MPFSLDPSTVAVCAAGALAAFVVVAAAASRFLLARIVAGVGAVLLVPVTAYCTLVAFTLMALRCDETCGTPGGSGRWRDARGAWQWDVQFLVAGVGAAAVVVALLALAGRRYPAAVASAALATACYVGWAVIWTG